MLILFLNRKSRHAVGYCKISPFDFALLDICVRRGRVKMNQTWQTICCVPHVPWRHELWWSIHSEGGVLRCLSRELFLISSYSSGKSDQYFKKRYHLHDMVHCLNQHIAWLSLLVVVLCYHFEKLNPPKCTRCMPRCAHSDGNVAVSGQKLVDLRVRIAA